MLDRAFYDIPLGLFFILLTAGFVACSQLGIYWGQGLRKKLDETGRSGIQNVQVSVLGLVGLMLAFSFSMASARFERRRSLVIEQANAIGTTLLRTDFVPQPEAAHIREIFKAYLQEALVFSDYRNDQAHFEASNHRMEQMEMKIWSEAIQASRRMSNPSHTTLFFAALNEVIDIHTARKTAQKNRVPGAILASLALMCMLAMFTVGFGWGIGQFQHMTLRFILGLILVMTLTLIVDMDRPRRGLIQVSQEPIQDLLASFEKPR